MRMKKLLSRIIKFKAQVLGHSKWRLGTDNRGTASQESRKQKIKPEKCHPAVGCEAETWTREKKQDEGRTRGRGTVGEVQQEWGGSSGGESSSGGSSGSSSQEGTITFVEPSYRPSNLSVGSRGHLKIDYSWSWNRLDDFVRTTSPKDVGKGGKGGGGGLDDDPYYSTIINHNHHHHHHHHQEPRHSTHTTIIPSHHHHHHHHAAQEPTLEPWERQLDPVAG
ncbi:hypothetical protein Pmani_014135 [Petrolisthes manimaculis]|uniref:Uncharacterized protein n=1 Tax=Petrolisthes manimaculis TaxID=1843537 RepID=A0AAE1PTG0_9EUCA|nr:hypothetical protein Pmani_014135 [Petrolisthes manimaculis]